MWSLGLSQAAWHQHNSRLLLWSMAAQHSGLAGGMMNFLMSSAMGIGGKSPLQRDVCSSWSVGSAMGQTIREHIPLSALGIWSEDAP